MLYRSRIHSVTNFTPIELMFGRSVNGYDDFRELVEDPDEEEALKEASR